LHEEFEDFQVKDLEQKCKIKDQIIQLIEINKHQSELIQAMWFSPGMPGHATLGNKVLVDDDFSIPIIEKIFYKKK
jgi:hypothetical protein